MTLGLKHGVAVACVLAGLTCTARGQGAPVSAPAEGVPSGTAVLGNTSPWRG